MKGKDKVAIWTDDAVEKSTKAALPDLAKRAVARTVEVSADALQANIRSFLTKFAALLDDGTLGDTKVVVDEVELSLTVTASGGVELLGKLSAGGEAGIKVKLKRQENPK
jgi:hypothetical protein